MPWFARPPDIQQPDKMKYTLKAAPAASAIELQNENRQKQSESRRTLVSIGEKSGQG